MQQTARINSPLQNRRPAVQTAAGVALRMVILLGAMMMFFPACNPSKISVLISKNISLFTSGLSYASLTGDAGRALLKGWVSHDTFRLLYFASMLIIAGIAGAGAGACMSIGNDRLRHIGGFLCAGGGAAQLLGLGGVYMAYRRMQQSENLAKVAPEFPAGFAFFVVIAGLTLLLSVAFCLLTPRPQKGLRAEMAAKYRLFLMFMPFAALAFVFAYLPLYGWRYAFFDSKPGIPLTWDTFAGLKWFRFLFENAATRSDIVRVMTNTLVMSGLGILTSWCPMAVAIGLSELRSKRLARAVQTIITIPNFISWVLVYAIAMAIFASDGFINGFLGILGVQSSVNYLMGNSGTWLKMLLWGMWKGLGWSAIIYVAAISGIDQQLYEAATVDGAGRFAKMRYVTIPGLLPTYCVLLLMSVAGILSNGMDQYLVFENAQNTANIEVLDLYVYHLGFSRIKSNSYALPTVVGMMKTIISLVLLFSANRVSKAIRGESIV